MSRLAEISRNLLSVQQRIDIAAASVGRNPSEIELIAVTKNFPVSDAQILYDLGIRNFGENRDQEGALKFRELPSDLRWHFQGQIQGGKIKSIASWADSVHSLDSLEHATKFAALLGSKVEEFFIQVNLEPDRLDRGGVAPSGLESFLSELRDQAGLVPSGLMVVAPLGVAPAAAFSELKRLQMALNETFSTLKSLSMGMSGDFEVAICAGATHVRIGSSILGSRTFPA